MIYAVTRMSGLNLSKTANSALLIASVLLSFIIVSPQTRAQESPAKVSSEMEFLDPAKVSVAGLLGDAITASKRGRLTQLPAWNNGELITMFSVEARDKHHKTDWRGEHGGKWLYATASAARQGDNPELKNLLLKTADYLLQNQGQDGYLANYSSKVRITNAEANHVRSWDAWNLSYMTLGLLEVHHHFPEPKYLEAAKKIGDLLVKTFGEGKHDITEYGTRHGISATIILDPVVELYKITGDDRYLRLAETIIARMEARPGANIVTVAANGGDMELVGDGKAYQLLWNLTAIAKLYEVTGNPEYLKAVTNAWDNIKTHHLTIAGGPWGGVGKHLECFNKKGFWNPYGFIETCSTMSWIQLNKVMLRLTGEAKYADEIERAAYNALLGAQFPNGVDWAYHSFSNGRRHIAHFDDCCPSSGALALQELPALVYAAKGKGISCNLFTASTATITVDGKNDVRIVQETNYPFDGKVRVTLSPARKATFPLFVRIPAWADAAEIRVNDTKVDTRDLRTGDYFKIERVWRKGDFVEVTFPLEIKIHRNAERVGSPQGGPDLYRVNWFAMTRGPLVFSANGLVNGRDRESVIALPEEKPESKFSVVATPEGFAGPAYEFATKDGTSVLFLPYFEAGGRELNAWRLTWLQNGIE